MHQIEPFYRWREQYVASDDALSPFHGREYNEFQYSTKIYNYFIHPQWDDIGSPTLFAKILYTNYQMSFTVIELMGEWNDCIQNDVMFLKQNLINPQTNQGINKFIIIGENVLNFHYSDDCYYEEWNEEVTDEGGWVAMVNFREHILQEMNQIHLSQYLFMYNDILWRKLKPLAFCLAVEKLISHKLLV